MKRNRNLSCPIIKSFQVFSVIKFRNSKLSSQIRLHSNTLSITKVNTGLALLALHGIVTLLFQRFELSTNPEYYPRKQFSHCPPFTVLTLQNSTPQTELPTQDVIKLLDIGSFCMLFGRPVLYSFF